MMLVGVAGTMVPYVPGIVLVVAAAGLYAVATGFEGGVGVGLLAIYVAFAGATMAFDLLAHAVGARVFGGSRAGVVGALVGVPVGLLLGGPVGLLLGAFVGALAFEFYSHRQARQALRSGVGAVLGFLASSVVEFAVALGITVSFVIAVLTRA